MHQDLQPDPPHGKACKIVRRYKGQGLTMKWFYRFILLLACLTLLGSLTGIQQIHFSPGHTSVKIFSLADRILTFFTGIFFALWSYGVKKRTTWGKWITIIFFGFVLGVIVAFGLGKAIYDWLEFVSLDVVVIEFVIGILQLLIVTFLFKRILKKWGGKIDLT